MARVKASTKSGIETLPTETLIELVRSAAATSKSYALRVDLLCAKQAGVAALKARIDRELDALETTTTRVRSDREGEFIAGINETAGAIAEMLITLDGSAALERMVRLALVRFETLQRAPSDVLQGMFEQVYSGLGPVALAAPEETRVRIGRAVLERFATQMDADSGRALMQLFQKLPQTLQREVRKRLSTIASPKRQSDTTKHLLAVRATLADLSGDIDEWAAMAQLSDPDFFDPMVAAQKLHAAGRHAEALQWLSKPEPRIRRIDVGGRRFGVALGAAKPKATRDFQNEARVLLEAAILDGLGRQAEANALIWTGFEETLKETYFDAYSKRLGDFEEFEVLDKANAFVAKQKPSVETFLFHINRRNLQGAADTLRDIFPTFKGWIVTQPEMRAAADILSDGFPLEASLIYRAHVTPLMDSGGHQAEIIADLFRLDDLAAEVASWGGFTTHATFVARIEKAFERRLSLRKSYEAAKARTQRKAPRKAG